MLLYFSGSSDSERDEMRECFSEGIKVIANWYCCTEINTPSACIIEKKLSGRNAL